MSTKAETYFDRCLQRQTSQHQLTVIDVSFTQQMRIAAFHWGWLIETMSVDEDYVVTLETLARHRKNPLATLVNRERFGDEHNSMKTYARDDKYPLGSQVRLETTGC